MNDAKTDLKAYLLDGRPFLGAAYHSTQLEGWETTTENPDQQMIIVPIEVLEQMASNESIGLRGLVLHIVKDVEKGRAYAIVNEGVRAEAESVLRRHGYSLGLEIPKTDLVKLVEQRRGAYYGTGNFAGNGWHLVEREIMNLR